MDANKVKQQLDAIATTLQNKMVAQSKLEGIIEEKKNMLGLEIESLATLGVVIDRSRPKGSATEAVAQLEAEFVTLVEPIKEKYAITLE